LYQRARVNGQTLWILRGFVADGWERLPLIDGRAPVMLQIRAHDLDPSLVLQQNDHLTARDLADWPGLIGVVEPEASTPDNPAITAVGTRPSPNNNHLAYAIFWLVMSAVAAVFALLTMRQR
jgi:cytochrome oxidase assembly protein ShyY1